VDLICDEDGVQVLGWGLETDDGKVYFVRIGASMLLALFGALGAVHALAQGAKPGGYANETRDWGVPPTVQLRTVGYHAPTPLKIPGGKVMTTQELKALLEPPQLQ